MIELGSKIAKLRTDKKMSMRELAEKLDVSHAHVSKLESNKNLPSITLLQQIADLFDVHISYFFDIENVEDIEDVEELEPGIRIGFDKTKKDGLTEEDKQKALKFVKDLKEGKISILNITEKLNDIDI